MNTRRDALRILGAAAYAIQPARGADPAVHNHAAPADEPQQPVAPYVPYLQPGELATLEAMSECIIPRSETPGAKDVGVALAIDRAIVAKPQMGAMFRSGLADLNVHSRATFGNEFAALTAVQQVEVLTPLSLNPATPMGKFFTQVKNMTIDAYYKTEVGLKTELGWHGNTYVPDFPGCDHPDHHQS